MAITINIYYNGRNGNAKKFAEEMVSSGIVNDIRAENGNIMEIIKIREHKEMSDRTAQWFHSKWGIPLEAYAESINECMKNESSVPQWYIAVEKDEIIGGLGVIENDFHDRKDLTPNVCAVYVEEEHRCKGIAVLKGKNNSHK